MCLRNQRFLVVLCLILTPVLGCGDDDADGSSGLEIAGVWKTNYDTQEVITQTTWNGSEIVHFDNETNVAVVQSPADAEYFPGKFSQLVWTEKAGARFHYCTSAFAPKHYPEEIVKFANTRGADKVMFTGYFPAGLSMERQFTEMAEYNPFKDEVWPKFLRGNAIRILKLDEKLGLEA